MPIKFLTNNKAFAEAARKAGFVVGSQSMYKYVPSTEKKTYFVFYTNSIGDIDYYWSPADVFVGMHDRLRSCIHNLEFRRNLFGESYLPIGSCHIFDLDETAMVEAIMRRRLFGVSPVDVFTRAPKGVIIAPISLCGATVKEDISQTRNIFYSTQAVLYALLVERKHNMEEIDIIFPDPQTSFISATMSEEDMLCQMMDAIKTYPDYVPEKCGYDYVLKEPNLLEQPPTYMNTAFFTVASGDLKYM